MNEIKKIIEYVNKVQNEIKQIGRLYYVSCQACAWGQLYFTYDIQCFFDCEHYPFSSVNRLVEKYIKERERKYNTRGDGSHLVDIDGVQIHMSGEMEKIRLHSSIAANASLEDVRLVMQKMDLVLEEIHKTFQEERVASSLKTKSKRGLK